MVAVLGILSKCESLRDRERFARRHYAVLTELLGFELNRPPSDSAFHYFFPQVDVVAVCAAIRVGPRVDSKSVPVSLAGAVSMG